MRDFLFRHRRSALWLAMVAAGLPFLLECARLFIKGVIGDGLLTDDAYLVMRLAMGWSSGMGYSLDGIEATNGLQSLWLWLLTLLGLVVPGDVTWFYMAVLGFVALINGLSILLFHRLYRERLGEVGAWFLPLAMTLAFPDVYWSGLETVLAMPLLYLLVAQLIKPPGRAACWHIGWILALLLLIRADSVALLLPLLLWVVVIWRVSLPKLGQIVLPALMAAALYALICYAAGNAVLPVHLLAASLGSPAVANFSVLGDLLSWSGMPVIAGLMLLWLVVELLYASRREGLADERLVVLLLAALGVQMLLHASLSSWPLTPSDSYLAVAMVLPVMLRVHALTQGGLRLRSGPLAMQGALVALLTWGAMVHLPVWTGTAHEGAVQRNWQDIRSGQLAGRTLIMGEHAGRIAFWSPTTRVMQAEGRTGSADYLGSRLAGHSAVWIARRHDIDEVVVDRPWLPTLYHGGDRVYLVVEPVRARLWQDGVGLYCFPQFAVLSEAHSDSYSRLRFDYAERMTCPKPLMEWLNSVNQRGQLHWLSNAVRPDGMREQLISLDRWLARRQGVLPQLIRESPEPL